MEIMTTRSTSSETFEISVTNGSPNYNIIFSNQALLLAVLLKASSTPIYAIPLISLIQDSPISCINFSVDKTQSDTIPIADKIKKVLKFYSLGKKHLCKIVGITRPALYAWLDGSSNPDKTNFFKIEQMYSISNNIDKNNTHNIFNDFIDYPLPGYSQSLLDTLISSKDLNTNYVINYIKEAYTISVKREENIKLINDSSFKIKHSEAEQNLNLEENI